MGGHTLVLDLENVIFDVDGVFTDGSFLYNENGKCYKRFGAHDSDGLKLLRKHKLNLLAISADSKGFKITEKRMIDMGIDLELVSESNRFKFVSDRFDLEKTVFVGDGVWDSKLLKYCCLGIAPANATEFAKLSADVILKRTGGDGAVLEVAEVVIKRINGEKYWTDYLKKNW